MTDTDLRSIVKNNIYRFPHVRYKFFRDGRVAEESDRRNRCKRKKKRFKRGFVAIIFSFSSNSRPKWLQDRYQLFPPPQRVLVKGGVSLWLANDRFVTPTTTALDISFQFLLLSWTLSNLDRPRMIDLTRTIRGSVAF